jgi:uncharacterized protein YaaR (DUF327 family)
MQETEREKKYKDCIEAFYKIAIKALSSHPNKLEEFNYRWKRKEYRLAFMPFMEVNDKRKETAEEKEICKNFYGLFVH